MLGIEVYKNHLGSVLGFTFLFLSQGLPLSPTRRENFLVIQVVPIPCNPGYRVPSSASLSSLQVASLPTHCTQLVSQSLENRASTQDFSAVALGPAGGSDCWSLLWPTIGVALTLTLLVPIITPARTALQDISLLVPIAAYSFINDWLSEVLWRSSANHKSLLFCPVPLLHFHHNMAPEGRGGGGMQGN